jgi:hypothetical protein
MKLRVIGLSLVAVFMLSAVSMAAAHEFVSSGTGTIKVVGVGEQEFKIFGKKVDCTTLAGSGSTATTKASTQVVTLKFTGCEAFGSAGTVTAASYLFDAEGTVGIKTAVVITDPTGKCSVQVFANAANASLKSISFASGTKNKTLKVNANVAGIEAEANGGTNTCGTVKTKGTGTYIGEATSEVEGSTLEWK